MVSGHTLEAGTMASEVMRSAHIVAAGAVAVTVIGSAHTLAAEIVAVTVIDVHNSALTDFAAIQSRRRCIRQCTSPGLLTTRSSFVSDWK
jgi:hypothetical protein